VAVTILTGAGASRPLGYPTTTEFFPEPGGAAPNAAVLAALTKQLGDPVDVEKALAILDPIVEFRTTPSGRFLHSRRGTNWWEEIEAFTTWTQERCFELYGVLPELEQVRELYSPLLDLLDPSTQTVSLFTANYDPVTDFIIEIGEAQDIRCFDGFGQAGWWQPSTYGQGRTGLDIFRLHGSMSWVLQGGRVKNTRDYSLRRGKTSHLVIYPGYKGDPMDDPQEVYRFAHDALCRDLLTTNVLIAVGFSFRDEHITKAVTDAFRQNSDLRLVIVNPEWPAGIQSILDGSKKSRTERVVHVEHKFGTEEAVAQLASVLGAST